MSILKHHLFLQTTLFQEEYYESGGILHIIMDISKQHD